MVRTVECTRFCKSATVAREEALSATLLVKATSIRAKTVRLYSYLYDHISSLYQAWKPS